MVEEQFNPSIREFKQFINKQPHICEDIHAKNVNIQSLYEKWILLGEEDTFWKTYTQGNSRSPETDAQKLDDSQGSDLVQTIMNAAEKMDMTKIENYVEEVSTAVRSVQEIVQQFNKEDSHASPKSYAHSKDGFFKRMRD